MNTKFNTTIISLLALVILAAVAAACSDDKPAAEGQAPTASAGDVQPEVEVLQSDRKFITIALSRYHSSVNDIDPSVFHPWCTPPDAESVTVPPKVRKSPPVPEYLPEGVSFDKAVHEDGRHIADIYTGDGGIRLNVMYGTCLITSRAPELLEQVSVAGSWGVIARNMKDLFETLTLYVETELGYVEIHRIDTANKGRVGKDELIEIAESLPVFGGQAAEGQAPAASAGDAQTEVEVLQSDRKFITIALSRYRSDVSSVDPSVLHPWCTHPDAESVTVPPKVRKSPPVPEYLPEGVSFHKDVHVGGTHYGSIYTSDGGNGNHIRLNVTHRTCLTTAKAPEFIEQTSVAGNWGVFLSGAKGAGSFDLHFETDLGVVSISRVITGGKEETVTKDKLIRIAESMPIFSGEAASTDTPSSDTDIMVSALGFIRVGLAGRNIDDVYPPGLHESCVSPGPGYPPPAAKMEVGPPPVPAYLPEGVSLDQESHFPDGSHIGSIYAGKGGPNSGVRVTVRHGVCESVTAPAPSDGGDSWELTSVEGNWGIFFHEDGNTILNLTMETESGFVEIRSVDLQAKGQNRIGKDELIKIAESMPVFGGGAASDSAPDPQRVSTSTPGDEKEAFALNSFAKNFRGLEDARQTINDEFLTIGEELDASEFSQVFSVLDRVIRRQGELIREVEAIDARSEVTTRLKDDLEFAYSEQLEGYAALLAMTNRAYGDQPTGKPREMKEKYHGMYAHALRRLSNGEGYVKRVNVELNKQFLRIIANPRQES